MNHNSHPMRGDVYWVCLDPTVGSEVKKTRPAVIISNNFGNKFSKRVIVAPITSTIDKIYPFESKIHMPQGVKKVMVDQIRCIDKIRLQKKMHSLTKPEMQELDKVLIFVLSL